VPQDLYHKVLLRLHTHVIPHMMAPNMLADFLTYALNQGAMYGVLLSSKHCYSKCLPARQVSVPYQPFRPVFVLNQALIVIFVATQTVELDLSVLKNTSALREQALLF